MHPSALLNCQAFFDTYGPGLSGMSGVKVVEIGAQNVNGSIRQCAPSTFEYVGVDFVRGNGVDVVIEDPYKLPFESESVDIVVTSSCLEHSEMFWLSYLEMLRLLKPHGLLYINVPSNGAFHRFPVDCWRFYPDSATALVNWGKRNGYSCSLLESYTSAQTQDVWNDYVMVIAKEEAATGLYPKRIFDGRPDYSNVVLRGQPTAMNVEVFPEDKRRLMQILELVKDASSDLSDAAKLDRIGRLASEQVSLLESERWPASV